MLVGVKGAVAHNPSVVARSSSLMHNPDIMGGKLSPMGVHNKIDLNKLAAHRNQRLEGGGSKQSTSRAILKEA